MILDNIQTAVASIADRPGGFKASAIAEMTGETIGDVQGDLVAMVDRGELSLEYQLVCPQDGAVLGCFKRDQPLPIGQKIKADGCEPFIAEKRHFLVTYLPQAVLLQALLGSERTVKAQAA